MKSVLLSVAAAWSINLFIIRIFRRWREPALRLRVGNVFEWCFVPWAPSVLTPGEIEHDVNRIVRGDGAEEWIIQFPNVIQRLHKHGSMSDLTGQQVLERLLR